MKLKMKLMICGAALALAGACHARTWTSADGGKTFEGDFVSATDTMVTINRGGKSVTFELSKLSSDDQAFVKTEVESAAANAKAKEESEKLKEAVIPKALSGNLVKLDSEGKKYEKFELSDGTIPKYYIIYFSASWCPPCRASVPQFVEYYKSDIATNSDVELVWATADRDEGDMEEWAKKEKFPWPTIKFKSARKISEISKLAPSGVPGYVLVDAEGKVLASQAGSSQPIKDKLKELTKS